MNRTFAIRKYDLTPRLYDRFNEGGAIAGKRRGECDELKLTPKIWQWLTKTKKRIADGKPLTADEQRYEQVLAAAQRHAPSGVPLAQPAQPAAEGQLDSKGVTEQKILEKFDRAVLGEQTTENAEAFAKIHRALADGELARRKEEMIDRQAEKLASLDSVVATTKSVSKFLQKHFNALAEDRKEIKAIADESGATEEQVKAVLVQAQEAVEFALADSEAMLEGRVDEIQNAAITESQRRLKIY